MLRLAVLMMVVLGLSGCPDFGPISGGVAPNSPQPSNVIEDANGQKYFVVSEVTAGSSVIPPKALYAWDAGTQTWVKQTTFASNVGWNEIFMGQAGNIWLNNYESGGLLPTVNINPQTLQVKQYSLKVNQFLVDGDKAVEYQGALVNSYQPTTSTSVYLYSLPTANMAAQAMGLTLNVQPYKMLCMPVIKYGKWGGQTHYCMMANDVFYLRDLANAPVGASNGNNDVIEFMVSITNTGNTYQLIDRFQTPLTAILQNPPVQENFVADFPTFSALMKVECGGTVDKQGNYHQFCNDTGDYTKFTYRFYDKTAPATPLYTQVLP